MQYNVIQIRYQPRLTHREDPDSIPETVIVSLQLFPACTKNSIIPVAEKLAFPSLQPEGISRTCRL